MATYVLVHGAWHGGWCWRAVADRLRGAGHVVFTPTLTGLGERSHLVTPGTGLRTHVEDVCGVLRYEDLRDVVLVGHSYAGFVVREAADRMPDRVARLVMVDGWAGRDGESLDDRAPEYFRAWVDTATVDGLIRPPRPSAVGVTEPDVAAWLTGLLTPQPRYTFAEPTRLTGAVDDLPCRAVLCTPAGIPFADWAREFGWSCVDLATGHDAMITAPDALTRLLAEA
ncbi:MAG TPA: alpha/beta fold hydrolase [Micromonosporaceae bacterium]